MKEEENYKIQSVIFITKKNSVRTSQRIVFLRYKGQSGDRVHVNSRCMLCGLQPTMWLNAVLLPQ